jgi:hypothetical protein
LLARQRQDYENWWTSFSARQRHIVQWLCGLGTSWTGQGKERSIGNLLRFLAYSNLNNFIVYYSNKKSMYNIIWKYGTSLSGCTCNWKKKNEITR